jgi:cysteine-rich repeat protein
MKKLITCIGLCLGLAVTASGCDLYLGDHHGGDGRDPGSWTECRNDGAYQCTINGCYWYSSQCDGQYQCNSNQDCAAGCYCAGDKTCQEAGFCTTNTDCGTGYVCDPVRSSCVPDTNQCNKDSDCSNGKTCDVYTHTCVARPPARCGDRTIDAGEVCDDGNSVSGDGCSADCKSNEKCGNGILDASKGEKCDDGNQTNTDDCSNTCQLNPGSCAGAITCSSAPPTCPGNSVPLIKNGCYTGQCQLLTACDAPPVCTAIHEEGGCLARTDCDPVYVGLNCRRPDGAACRAGDAQCTCETFAFSACTSTGPI